MAKKKRQPPETSSTPPPKRGSKPPGRSRPRSEATPSRDDRRVLEGFMRDLLEGLFEAPDETPLGQAQEIIHRAFEVRDPRQQIELARQALEVSPDCVDAYVLLAEHAQGRKEAFELYAEAVAVGERVLGPEVFQEDVGHFWGLLETRPYMRARLGLAEVLWTMGRREEAIGHLQEMLRLNPNDNQGLRYILAGWLLSEGRDKDLAGLLDQFPDEASTAWAYTKALLAFRRGGDTPEARHRLQDARKRNKHVPAYLLGQEPLPSEPPDSYSHGDRDEAIIYAASALGGWKATPGAITWLREAVQGPKKGRRKAPAIQGPSATAQERLRRLPQELDVWQTDCRPLSQWVEIDGQRVRPWMVLVTSRSHDLVLAHAITEEPPSADQMWDVLAGAVQRPAMGEPHRPTELQVRPHRRWEELKPHLEQIGVACVAADELDQLDAVYEGLARHLAGDQPPGLLEMPGVDPERVGRFYQAAAEFYRRAPWRSLGYEEAIRVECDQLESGPWYAVVMGQSGLTLGLALYEDLDLLKRLWAGRLSDQENARQTVALTVLFDAETDIPPADLDAARRYGWEVAGPEAYPLIIKKERGLSMRPPLAWELELMEGCLRAIPDYVTRHRRGDSSSQRGTVPTASGELRLVLSWVDPG